MLGLFDGPSGGAALFDTGRCIGVAHEDRELRRSGGSGLPDRSIRSVLDRAGVSGSDVHRTIVVTGNSAPPRTGLCRIARSLPVPPAARRLLRRSVAASRRSTIVETIRADHDVSGAVDFIDHHVAHAIGAVCTTGLSSAIVATMDAGADNVWATMTTFDPSGATYLASEGGDISLLSLLGAVAERAGIPEGLDRYRNLEELAATGVPHHYDRMETAFRFSGGSLFIDEDLFRPGGILATLPRSARKEDLAASALALVADCARRWIVHWFVRTDHKTLVLAGDLFELPSVVRVLFDAPEIRHRRVSVIPGDRGLPVAAAYAAYVPGILPQPLEDPAEVLISPLRGPSFEPVEIARALFREDTEPVCPPNVEADVARFLTEGRVVARLQGPAEIGDRAAGNRVILRSPDGTLQAGRIGFSLGAGAYHVLIRAEDFPRYFRPDGVHSLDVQCQPLLVTPTEEFDERFPGFLRHGKRLPVQTVSRAHNPSLHDLLTEFESWSGFPLLAAAPFRLPNQPVVNTPRDAVRVFRLLGADYAALGPYLVPSFHESGTRMIGSRSRNPASGT